MSLGGSDRQFTLIHHLSVESLKLQYKGTQGYLKAVEKEQIIEWINTHQDFCLFRAADTRSRRELESQLGSEYNGVISSDDLSVYNGYPVMAQQICKK